MRQRLTKLLRGNPEDLQEWIEDPGSESLFICLTIILIGFGAYGFTVGLWRDPIMGCYVALKMPFLIFTTLAFNGFLNGILGILLGSGLGFRQSILAQLISFTIAALILGSLSPILFFTALTSPEPDPTVHTISYASFLSVHTILIGIAGVFANVHLARLLIAFARSKAAAAITFIAWLGGNAFLGTQLAWLMRPFLGSPNIDIQFVRPDAFESNFYETAWYALRRFSGGHPLELLALLAVITIILILPLIKTFEGSRRPSQAPGKNRSS
ncbi:MAG: hypothetical protein ACON5H_08595 [Akkermansiaceae bacterium]